MPKNILRMSVFPILLLLLSPLILAGCDTGELPELSPTSTAELSPTSTAELSPTSTEGSGSMQANYSDPEDSSYLIFNQLWIEGLSSSPIDLDDVDAVFWRIFSGLADEVTVYPSENYYYYKLYIDGKQLWGNIRLPAGRRERGVLSFAYFEFKESPLQTSERMVRSKYFTKADGLILEELDKFTYLVSYNGKDVKFHFHELSQEPPKLFSLADNEFYIERTFDESGYQFFLLFNAEKNIFIWVLNEEELIPDILDPIEDDLLLGKRSGFAFWIDAANDNRKVLIAIRGQSAVRNDYYDGPFDQLADNYVDEIPISEYMQRASPSLIGRIDKYGYFTDREQGRVSISPYYVYFTLQSLSQFLAMAKESENPYQFISTGRLPSP
jgi:hypothetical protein